MLRSRFAEREKSPIVRCTPNTQLRKQLRTRRQSLTVDSVLHHSRIVTSLLMELLTTVEDEYIACYLAQDNEIDLSEFIVLLLQRRTRVCVPVVQGNEMFFANYLTTTSMTSNRWGIVEPTNPQLIDLTEIDVVVAPLVAFSNSGRRLGRGGGYYDRIMKKCEHTLYIGVAHSCQQSNDIETDDHDIPLDAIVTELGVQVFQTDKPQLTGLNSAV